MPRYDIENIKTGEIFEIEMKISEYDAYFENNPTHQRVHLPDGAPGIGDPVRLGIRRPPKDFQTGVLDRIKANNPHGKALSRTRWGNNISEI